MYCGFEIALFTIIEKQIYIKGSLTRRLVGMLYTVMDDGVYVCMVYFCLGSWYHLYLTSSLNPYDTAAVANTVHRYTFRGAPKR